MGNENARESLSHNYQAIDPTDSSTTTVEPKPPSPPQPITLLAQNRTGIFTAIERANYFWVNPTMVADVDLKDLYHDHVMLVKDDVLKISGRISKFGLVKAGTMFRKCRERLEEVEEQGKRDGVIGLTKEIFENVLTGVAVEEDATFHTGDLEYFTELIGWKDAVQEQTGQESAGGEEICGGHFTGSLREGDGS